MGGAVTDEHDRGTAGWRGALLAVFVVGSGIRVLSPLRAAGFDASHHYDASVYYAAAASLAHGRTPYVYDQFVLLHPPVVMLVLLPAAVLGHFTTDRFGFLAANLEVASIGALNAVLVAVLAHRVGCSRRAAAAAGLLYAVWLASWNGETAARLEPVGNAFLLLALIVLTGAVQRLLAGSAAAPATPGGRRLVLAGALFGVAANVKIWYVVPALIAVVWLAVRLRATRPVGTLAVGLVAAFLVVDLPFLIASRGEMWSMVVTAQLGREPDDTPLQLRWPQLMGAVPRTAATDTVSVTITGVVLAATVLAVVALAWRLRPARLFAVLAVVHVAILLGAPSWFPEYADFAAVPLCLCVAAAGTVLSGRWRTLAWLAPLAAAAVTTAVFITGSLLVTGPWGRVKPLQVAARDVRCVQSDSPAGLIALNALDRSLQRGCEVWIDVTGRTYLGHDHGPLPRTGNLRWQQSLVRHLRCGGAAFFSLFGHQRAPATVAAVERDGVLAQSVAPGTRVLYRVDQPSPGCRR